MCPSQGGVGAERAILGSAEIYDPIENVWRVAGAALKVAPENVDSREISSTWDDDFGGGGAARRNSAFDDEDESSEEEWDTPKENIDLDIHPRAATSANIDLDIHPRIDLDPRAATTMLEARWGAAAAVCWQQQQPGRLELLGGFDADGMALSTCESFDVNTETFNQTTNANCRNLPPMREARASLAVCVLPGRSVVVMGGQRQGHPSLSSVELFDLCDNGSGGWVYLPPMLSYRSRFQATTLVLGGCAGSLLAASQRQQRVNSDGRGDGDEHAAAAAAADLQDPACTTIRDGRPQQHMQQHQQAVAPRRTIRRPVAGYGADLAAAAAAAAE